MDPVTIVGFAGAIVSVIDVITRSVHSLYQLQSKFKGRDLTISLLIGQLSTLKAALNQINEWIETSLVAVQERQQLVLDLKASLESCKVVIQLLDDRVRHFEEINSNAMYIQSRVRYLWGQTGITEYLNHLNNQTSALNLLLTALQCRSLSEQSLLLENNKNRQIITKARDNTSSLLWFKDAESRITRQSILTENSYMLDVMFDFDNEILNSKPYQGAMRSNIRYGLNRLRKAGKSSEEPLPSMTTSSTISTLSERDEQEMHLKGVEFPSRRDVENGANQSYDIGKSPLKAAHGISIRTGELHLVNTFPKKQTRNDGSIEEIPQTYGQRLFRSTSNLLANRKTQNRSPTSRNGAQTARSKGIDRCIKKDRMAKDKEVKLLFLGAAGSGKSTVLNQMRLLYQRDYTMIERESFRPVIFSNMVKLMRKIVEAMDESDLCLHDKGGEHYIQKILAQPPDPKWNNMPSEITDAINFLWMDSGVQNYCQRPKGCQIGSSARHYFDSISRIAGHDYLPTDQDILQCYIENTGITETNLSDFSGLTYRCLGYNGVLFGQRNWAHYFEDVIAILFVVSLADYDQMPSGNKTCTSIQESLDMFDSICKSRWLGQTPIVLIFNKMDLFNRKVFESPVKSHFPDCPYPTYRGGRSDIDAAKNYFLHKFLDCNHNPDRQFYYHFTSATTDNSLARNIIVDVKDALVQHSLTLSLEGRLVYKPTKTHTTSVSIPRV